jgi:hypothetical protein
VHPILIFKVSSREHREHVVANHLHTQMSSRLNSWATRTGKISAPQKLEEIDLHCVPRRNVNPQLVKSTSTVPRDSAALGFPVKVHPILQYGECYHVPIGSALTGSVDEGQIAV